MPVIILPGLNHSSFCPGTDVKGDIFPAEAFQDLALQLIGETVAAFLGLHTDSAQDLNTSLNLLTSKMLWTRELLAPMDDAYELEAGVNSERTDSTSPLCELAQKTEAGVAYDKVDISSY